MKFTRRTICFTLLAAMLLPVLCACNPSNPPDETTGEETTIEETTTAALDETESEDTDTRTETDSETESESESESVSETEPVVMPTMELLPFFDGTEYMYTLMQPDDVVKADNEADLAFLQGVLTELCGTPIGTCEANCENPDRPLIIMYYEGETLDYAVRIDSETGSVTLTGGGKEALQRAIYTFTGSFLHVNPDGSVGLINSGDFVYDYSEDKIDNSSLLEYIPTDEVSLIKSNYAANSTLMSPEWMQSLIMVEVRLDTASIGGSFRDSYDLIDHYAAMGVNGIWLTPIYDFGTSNGYGNCGPHTIDPRFTGTTDYEEGWLVAKEFVDYAHSKGIYIFFDVITWGADKNCDLVKEKPEWFNGEAWGNSAFDWGNEEFVEWFIQTCVNNIMVTGADGFRCDCEPNYSGYDVFEEIRKRLNDQGKYVMIMAEDKNARRNTYDMEQDGVICIDRGQLYSSGYNFFVDGLLDIVITTQRGRGLAYGGGDYRFYTNCISNHDYQKRPVQGNRLKINYAAILAPYIPLWYQGEEFNSYNPPQVIYDGPVDHAYLEVPANALFFEDVKAAIQIRRTYPDLFAYWPLKHVDTNLCGVTIQGWEDPNAPAGEKGAELSAYARYVSPDDPNATTEGVAFLVVPNHVESISGVGTVTIPVKDAHLEGYTYFKVTDMSTGRIIAYLDASSPSFTTTIPYNYTGMYLVEGV